MKGNDDILKLLNDLLTNELTAINQYFVHAKMCANWGYQRLAKKIRDESIDEMKDADEIIERILFLEGIPNLQRLGKLHVGQTVKEQLTSDLAIEHNSVKFLNDGIALARQLGDNGTEAMLTEILTGEEGHADWLETQLSLIDQIGEAHYLAQQLHE